MNLQPQEKQLVEGYLKSFTDNLNISLCFHIAKIVIPDPYDRDVLIVDITQHFIEQTTPLLESLSKDNIFLRSKCVEFVKNLASQFIHTEQGKKDLFEGRDLTAPVSDETNEPAGD